MTIACASLIAASARQCFAASPATPRLFGCVGLLSAETARFSKWRAVAENRVWDDAEETDRYLAHLNASRDEIAADGALQQLSSINRLVNQVRYRSDPDTEDRWASPEAFLEHGGDCEDYAILKYRLLRGLGWSADQLKIVALRDRRRKVNHAICAALLDGKHYVLDNVASKVLTDDWFPSYEPVYGINEQGWWLYVKRAPYSS